MKTILEFFASLGTAEIVITILLVAVIIYAYFVCKKLDKQLNKKLDQDQERFEKRRNKRKC